ncbi:hypothetical protein SDC9_204167 [bioreactor metagenome]|uniref:Uncharacterized protein n=1 Tax=bioreactor metagenome TaxID=1076179 RepID=A0A645IZ82_9ZZZZ
MEERFSGIHMSDCPISERVELQDLLLQPGNAFFTGGGYQDNSKDSY